MRLTYEHGLSVRAISERLQLSKTSVATYLLVACEAGLRWPLPPIYNSEAALQHATASCRAVRDCSCGNLSIRFALALKSQSFIRSKAAISPITPRRNSSTQITKITPCTTVTQAPICDR